jgi:hypothetical protein
VSKFLFGVEAEVVMEGDKKTINYNLSVEAENEEKALEKINIIYGLNKKDWNLEIIAKHLYDDWFELENPNHELLEITILGESFGQELHETYEI